jgi:hypothetical protein
MSSEIHAELEDRMQMPQRFERMTCSCKIPYDFDFVLVLVSNETFFQMVK